MAEKIRVLIVEDSAFKRNAIKDILESDPEIEVVGMAENGKSGIARAAALRPDVITMDIAMPVMDGVEAITRIMQETPIPIIIVSTLDNKTIIGALSAGAMDFVSNDQALELMARELTEKVKIASKVKPLRRMNLKPQPAPVPVGQSALKIVIIGSSTGGPQALQIFLSRLPPDFRGCILIVQHMSKGFIEGLAEWLQSATRLEVKVAKPGDGVKAGAVYFAPDDCNMELQKDGKFIFTHVQTGYFYPSANILMQSAAHSYGKNVIGVIMTGMAQDGVKGIKDIKLAGGTTIAQDEATSVIFGMNKIAIETGFVDRVVPLEKISEELVKIAAA